MVDLSRRSNFPSHLVFIEPHLGQANFRGTENRARHCKYKSNKLRYTSSGNGALPGQHKSRQIHAAQYRKHVFYIHMIIKRTK